LLHQHGALSFWDFAAAAPYVPIQMAGVGDDYMDAVFMSPHKFIGGPQTPGVLVVRRDLVRNRVPTVPGGGTVLFVDPVEQRYLTDPVVREEGGTPAIIESIRAGLVFGLKEAVGTSLIQAREERFWRRALHRWQQNPAIDILGNPDARRLSIVSLRIRCGELFLHHNFVVALLNDLFGIQARGGCLCAGPYGHRLLGIGLEQSHAFSGEVARGLEGIKPGWTRVNFNYFISDIVCDYLIDAVDLVADDGYRLLSDYHFDPATGLWRHRAGTAEPPLRLSSLSYDAAGELTYPKTGTSVGEDALAGYLAEARALIAARPDQLDDSPTGLPSDFEKLRWFHLPPGCLVWKTSDQVLLRWPRSGPPSACTPGRPTCCRRGQRRSSSGSREFPRDPSAGRR